MVFGVRMHKWFIGMLPYAALNTGGRLHSRWNIVFDIHDR